MLSHRRLLFEHLTQMALLGDGRSRSRFDQMMRLLLADGLAQCHCHAFRREETARDIEVGPHPVRVEFHARYHSSAKASACSLLSMTAASQPDGTGGWQFPTQALGDVRPLTTSLTWQTLRW